MPDRVGGQRRLLRQRARREVVERLGLVRHEVERLAIKGLRAAQVAAAERLVAALAQDGGALVDGAALEGDDLRRREPA